MSTTIDNVDYFNGTQKGSGVVIGIDPGIGGIPMYDWVSVQFTNFYEYESGGKWKEMKLTGKPMTVQLVDCSFKGPIPNCVQIELLRAKVSIDGRLDELAAEAIKKT